MANTALANQAALKPGEEPVKDGDQEPDPLELEGDDDEGEEPAAGGDLSVALKAERGKRKQAAAKLKAAEAKVAELTPLAAEYNQILPHLPELLKRAQQGAKPAGQQPPAEQAEVVQKLTEVAEAFGFVDDEGNPDLKRAARAQKFIDSQVRQQTAAEVAPVRAESAQAMAQQFRDKAYKATDNEGNLYAKKEYIDHVFGQIPPEALNMNTAMQALVMARGLGGAGEAPQAEPVFTEGTGGRRVGPVVLSDVDKRMAKLRGRSEKEWQKLAEDPKDTGNWELE